MKILRNYGTLAGEPYMKHLEGDIWELRPIRDRIFLSRGMKAVLYFSIIS
mgnify:FL=1